MGNKTSVDQSAALSVSDVWWFAVGQRVDHLRFNGPGTITEVSRDGVVKITYDRADDSGRHWFGVYPLDWFTSHPGELIRIPSTDGAESDTAKAVTK